MKKNIYLLLSLFLLSSLSQQVLSAQGNDQKPNIIIIYADDWGYSDLGVHGIVDDIYTPHIDELAKNGVRFTDGYVTAPQCAPSRAGFLTCKYQQSFGFDAIPSLPLNADQQLISDHMRSFGYTTGMVGKWHLDVDALSTEWAAQNHPDALYKDGNREKVNLDALPAGVQASFAPSNRGFDEYYFGERNDYIVNFPPHQDSQDGELITLSGDRVDLKSNASVDFIERNANKDKPFFLYTAYYAPHTPSTPTKKYLDQIPPMESPTRRKGLALMLAVDAGVGEIIKTLKEQNIYENTIVIFASDNGAPISLYTDNEAGERVAVPYVDVNHPLYTDGLRIVWDGSDNKPLNGDKGLLSEGGIRVPMMISWPQKIDSGQICNRPVNTLDLAKTMLTAAGDVSTLPALDGVDLLPYFNGEDDADLLERPLFWRFYTQTAVREGKWKLLRVSDELEFLFDMDADKEEKNNLIVQHPDVANELRSKLATWAGTTIPAGLPDAPLTAAEEMKFELFFEDQESNLNPLTDQDEEDMFKVYHGKELLHVITPKDITDVALFDSCGKVVRTIPYGQTIINVSGLPAGLYLVSAKCQGKTQVCKVVL